MLNIVMLPAMGCDRRFYADTADALAPHANVIVIAADQPDFATCCQQVLQQAPEQFVILGTSFGGRLALETALVAVSRVAGMVVIGAGAGRVADPVAGVRRTERLRGGEFSDVIGEMADMVSHLAGPRGRFARDQFVAMAKDMGPEAMARQSEALSKRVDLFPRLGEIACPSLMLWGAHDKFSPAAEGLKMTKALPNARYVEISECGHYPSLEAPGETIDILLHWLQDMKLISD